MSPLTKQHAAALFPLNDFYEAANVPLPPIDLIPGEAVPQPYRRLLVHSGDMTPTLEAYHGRPIHLRMISRDLRGGALFREVVLELDDGDQAVEFGAIKIHLLPFPPDAQAVILRGRRPLGTILADFAIVHHSRPTAYLRVQSDDVMNDALGLDHSTTLYGRRSVLSKPNGTLLAEVVEILPPIPAPGSNAGGAAAGGRVGNNGDE
jgi:chorismate-pyruvate lyase